MFDMRSKGFRAETDAAGGTLNLLIYGPIGRHDGDEQAIDAAVVVQQLQEFKGASIVVYINSPGGFIHEALAIYNALSRHPARKVVQIDGVCASAAVIIAMAGDRIVAADNAMLMVHSAWRQVTGDAADLRSAAGVLETLTETVVRILARRTGRPVEEVRKWLSDETWLTAYQAKSLGLVDEVAPPNRAAASWDWSRYGLTPPPADALSGSGVGALSGEVGRLRAEVAGLRGELDALRRAGGNADAAAVMSGLGEFFHEWLTQFKDAAVEVLQTDPAVLGAAAGLREDLADLERLAAVEADADAAPAGADGDMAALVRRVAKGPQS